MYGEIVHYMVDLCIVVGLHLCHVRAGEHEHSAGLTQVTYM